MERSNGPSPRKQAAPAPPHEPRRTKEAPREGSKDAPRASEDAQIGASKEAQLREQLLRQRALETIVALRDRRFIRGLRCPHCDGRRIHRWGKAHGRQRYRCLACRRTFSDLTGTPVAYLKRLDLLTRYLACMRECLSIRESARRLRVHPNTAFRWRHRLLDTLRRAPAPPLGGGWIELDCFWLAHSRKGERPFRGGTPRRRAPPCLITYQGPRVCVLLACDRRGGLLSALAPRSRPDVDGLEHLLSGRTTTEPEPPVLVSTRGPLGAEARLARRRGWTFARASGGLTGLLPWPVHVRTVVGYRVRFVRWLRRFKGVATKYLANYLAWHRTLDADVRSGIEANLVRWPLPSGFG